MAFLGKDSIRTEIVIENKILEPISITWDVILHMKKTKMCIRDRASHTHTIYYCTLSQQ